MDREFRRLGWFQFFSLVFLRGLWLVEVENPLVVLGSRFDVVKAEVAKLRKDSSTGICPR